jgi:hypothetical protein
MKNAVLWDVTLCGSCEDQRFGEMYSLHHRGDNQPASNNVNSNKQFLRSVLQLLFTANVVPS